MGAMDMSDSIQIRPMTAADRSDVAELICLSTNVWYQSHGRPLIFSGGPASTTVFFDVYNALTPGCGLAAVNAEGRLVGSCFYHPRPTHVSLGIMNVHPNYFGAGVARRLLARIIEIADQQGKPVRLVSSAMNLDSFSLYTRAGFVPRTPYQDMFLSVPPEGLKLSTELDRFVRPAVMDDVEAMVALEREVAGLDRGLDYRHFIANREGFWHMSVLEDGSGKLQGFMASSGSAGCNMVGPGTARTPAQAAALLLAELNVQRGRCPVFLAPVQCGELVRTLYAWGARNCETHFSQVRGPCQPIRGVHMPTFLPESC